MECGAGKTLTGLEAAAREVRRGGRCCIIALNSGQCSMWYDTLVQFYRVSPRSVFLYHHQTAEDWPTRNIFCRGLLCDSAPMLPGGVCGECRHKLTDECPRCNYAGRVSVTQDLVKCECGFEYTYQFKYDFRPAEVKIVIMDWWRLIQNSPSHCDRAFEMMHSHITHGEFAPKHIANSGRRSSPGRCRGAI